MCEEVLECDQWSVWEERACKCFVTAFCELGCPSDTALNPSKMCSCETLAEIALEYTDGVIPLEHYKSFVYGQTMYDWNPEYADTSDCDPDFGFKSYKTQGKCFAWNYECWDMQCDPGYVLNPLTECECEKASVVA